jgi:diguanylate cyclase (GGDEF)-like protein/putative nucleotidyltransferase with HDIG domain
MNAIRTKLRGASIRLRVFALTGVLAFTATAAVLSQYVNETSETFTNTATQQAMTVTQQVAKATSGTGVGVIGVIPFSEQGLDGMAIYDDSGKLQGRGGPLGGEIAAVGARVRAAVKDLAPSQQLVSLGGGRLSEAGDKLRPWTSDRVILLTIVPQDGGALVTAYRVEWATSRLRSSTLSTASSLLAGALFICFGLMLVLGRLVTRPLGRLSSEVLRLGEPGATLSPQRAPELQHLASVIAEMREDLTRATRASTTDPLTGVANHRGFHERFGRALEDADRDGLALVSFDLDNLKLVNDRYGHAAGDRMIAAFARALEQAGSEAIVCARVGGDEFAAVLRGGSREHAKAVGNQIAGVFAASDEAPDGMPFRTSFGVAVWPDDGRTRDGLIAAADAALYVAKRGRGRRDRRSGDAVEQSVRAISAAIDARDAGTGEHSAAVADMAAGIARRLRFEGHHVAALRRAALLHDSGKLGVPDSILNKPAPLDPHEQEIMREHSERGFQIAVCAGLPDSEALWIRHVHEHLDGSGYPNGLSADEIPLESRILLVADAYAAITSNRPYHPARTPEEALDELRACAGTQFDPAVVDALAAELARSAADQPIGPSAVAG